MEHAAKTAKSRLPVSLRGDAYGGFVFSACCMTVSCMLLLPARTGRLSLGAFQALELHPSVQHEPTGCALWPPGWQSRARHTHSRRPSRAVTVQIAPRLLQRRGGSSGGRRRWDRNTVGHFRGAAHCRTGPPAAVSCVRLRADGGSRGAAPQSLRAGARPGGGVLRRRRQCVWLLSRKHRLVAGGGPLGAHERCSGDGEALGSGPEVRPCTAGFRLDSTLAETNKWGLQRCIGRSGDFGPLIESFASGVSLWASKHANQLSSSGAAVIAGFGGAVSAEHVYAHCLRVIHYDWIVSPARCVKTK